MVAETYNGWSNYETWNVALWIQNDFSLYSIGCSCEDYTDFLSYVSNEIIANKTPDGVYYNSIFISHLELDEMIQELA